MSAAPRRGPVGFDQPLNRDLIQQTAYYFFGFRVVLGLASWMYYNEFVHTDFFEALPVHVLFVIYLAGNSLICLRFRAGQISSTALRADLVLNIGTATIVTALTGGLRSPIGVIVLMKIAGYLLVYGFPLTMLAAGIGMLVMGVIAFGNEVEWWHTTAAQQLDDQVDDLVRIGFLAASLVGAPWLLRQVDRQERQIQLEMRRTRASANRERAAHAVSRAILAVNEAINRATRLSDVLSKVVDVTPEVLGVDYCGIFLWNPDENIYRGAMVSGSDPAIMRQFAEVKLQPADVPDFEWVRQLGHCAIVAARGIARIGLPEAPTLLLAPLRSGDRFHGVLQLGRRDGDRVFTQNELLISDGIAAQTAVAIERARLVDESRRLSRAVDSTGEAVLITDQRGRIVYANPAFLKLFQYTWQELKGRDAVTYAAGLPAEQVAAIRRNVAESSWRGEAMGRRHDGSLFPMLVNVSIIRSADDPFHGVVAVITDISAERALQERMQRADRLGAAGQMAAGVAHEINNALVGILGEAEMARESDSIEDLHKAMRVVGAQGRRIADILQQMLRFARPQPPARRDVDLCALVYETLDLVATECHRVGVVCETTCADPIPPVLVDAKQIQQVLVNLFTNAIHAMQAKGGGTLAVSVAAAGPLVSVDVRDTGVGIAAEDLGRVFDPFFTTKDVGTGLGLSVSYSIVRAHGGDLAVRSSPGEGSTFTLSLPAVAVRPVASKTETALLVDDDPAVAETLIEMLSREGLDVHHVATGREALACTAERSFDMIFLDVRLPDISGPEIYARLAAEKPEQAQRVAFVTGGLWRADDRSLRDKLPPQPTLSKPCTPAQIREVLRLLRDMRVAA